ncbi:MAG: ABC transporter permease [Oscillospiraceae bacterium]|jgi:sodium transport system permease protein|nr:ABC transporter permease [Oscillospiraceae bacterium]
MNKNILTIMRKEFARFFRDPRMVFTALILPGLMIYAVYTFIGIALADKFMPQVDHVPLLYAVNAPNAIDDIAAAPLEIHNITTDEVEGIRSKLTAKDADLLLIFPTNFDAAIAAYQSGNSMAAGDALPNVELYYNSTNPDSMSAYQTWVYLLDEYKARLTPLFDINREIAGDLATTEDVMAFSIASMLPFLIVMMIFSGCMSLAPESIAGMKERGTIATILVTPIKRSELAVGKILSLGTLAFLCGLSSCIGVFLALPKMMNIGMDPDSALNMNLYAPTDYVLLVLIVLSTILVLVAAVSIVSAFAKTVKEANTSVMPIMLLVMAVGVSSMFGGTTTDTAQYLIPLYNSVQAMSGIFKFEINVTNLVVTVISNLVYAGICGVALTRLFTSEKVIFSR